MINIKDAWDVSDYKTGAIEHIAGFIVKKLRKLLIVIFV